MRPRVALLLSSNPCLPEPAPPDAEPSAAQVEAMLRTALEMAGPEIRPGEWAIIKPNIVCCPGLSPQYGPGGATDPRLVLALARWLRERGCGRITIAEGAGGWRPAEIDGWTTTWGGEFGGLSYTAVASECGAELLDLNFAPTIEYRAPSGRRFALPAVIRDCGRLFTLSPLKTNKGAGVSLGMKNYFGIAPGSRYGWPKFGLHALGPVPELIADLFAFRPDGFAILGGGRGVEGDGDQEVRHHVLIAGADCVASDAVAAAVMGYEPGELDFLRIAVSRKLGVADLDAIEVCGENIGAARRPFRRALYMPCSPPDAAPGRMLSARR